MIRRGLAAIVISLFVVLPGTAEAENGGPIATILCYHVVESPSDTHFAISREEFLRQIQYLKSTGYNIIPLGDLVRYYAGELKSLPENSIVITVDDGWRCTYDIIYKELSQLGVPFTAFLYPKFIIGGTYSLSWDQVREMADNGVDIQSHTLSHGYLTQDRSGRNGDYASWLANELSESKKILEQKVGKTVNVLAYPYGAYDDIVAKATEKAGYSAALTCNFGSVSGETDPFRLHRVVIDRKMSFDQFRYYLGVGKLDVTDVSPSPDRNWSPAYPVLGATIVDHDSVDPDSVRMTLGGEEIPFFYDRRDGSISAVLRDGIQSSSQSVFVWATDAKTGKRLEATWKVRPTPAREPVAAVVADTRELQKGGAGPALSGGSFE